jgi:uncharacterized repeat protein (TIGR03803 family)
VSAYLRNPAFVPVLLVYFSLVLTGQVFGQGYRILHCFSGVGGANPSAGLILSGNTLYGTTQYGGSSNVGTVFAINTDGTGFTLLHSFTEPDGANPHAVLALGTGVLYGTTSVGGSVGYGTVFQLKTDGTEFRTLYSFTNFIAQADGRYPQSGLILSEGTLYGVTHTGGAWGRGTVFSLRSDGTGFTVLYNFDGGLLFGPIGGYNAMGDLLQVGNVLYGTTFNGGVAEDGIVYTLSTSGGNFGILHSFSGRYGPTLASNVEGAYPAAGLILFSNYLYGTAFGGGTYGAGTVFRMRTDGSNVMALHNFTGTNDGKWPQRTLTLSGDRLFGVADEGGRFGGGTVFTLRTDGTGFTNLYDFRGDNDGYMPECALILSGDTLYGTTCWGGSLTNGTVFSLALLPKLSVACFDTNIVLSWPMNTDCKLESTTNLGPSAVWSTDLTTTINTNGQTTVTTPISGTQRFFRLRQ